MDVVVWLRCLGLRKYEATFRENDIDETVLPKLTAEDLKELAVMFSDLVGSTALSARMDPEDLREVISAYVRSRHRAAVRWGEGLRRRR
jgi:class 3 adenylate cyclase